MNIEIANRLMNLRKEKGYTQEELADALGISRQAVSKWERAEASPDTDNLICLAKLYGVSLDELLRTDESVDDIKDEKKEEKEEEKKKDKTYVNIGCGGIHVIDGDDEVHIGLNGIHVNSVNVNGKGEEIKERDKKISRISKLVFSVSSLVITLVYILWGLLKGVWHPTWILFLLIPCFCSVVDVVKYKRFSRFNFPVLVNAIYLVLGFYFNLWHPSWVIFLFIPLFYIILEYIEKEKKHSEVYINDEEDDE